MKSILAFTLLLVGAVSLLAAVPAGKTQQLTSPDQVPQGLAKSDWSSIRAAYEAGRHAFQPVPGKDGVWQARNPGQQWLTTFDQHGFVAQPQGGGWSWGLKLQSYGFGEKQTPISGQPTVKASGQRLSYQWDATVQEWWVNDPRGLEHGFTIGQRPDGISDSQSLVSDPLAFTLGVHGTLKPTLTADAQGLLFQDATGATVLNYTGLKVWDADGQVLPSRFKMSDSQPTVRLLVDERNARYPITIDPIAQQAYLKASNTESGDKFGFSVAIDGDTAVIGALEEDSSATGVNGNQADDSAEISGAAYVFTRTNGVWSQQAYLKASNTGVADSFGMKVAVSGDTIAVGAHGEDSNATGVDGNQANNSAASSGAVYVFTRSGSVWSQQAYLKASNTSAGDEFGAALSIAGDTILVGAPEEDSNATGINAPMGSGSGTQGDNSAVGSGAGYVFIRASGVWTQQAYLKASNTGANDWFGFRVAVSGDTVIIGAPRESGGSIGANGEDDDESMPQSGAAYIFTRVGGIWTQQAYLKASNTGSNDWFGYSVALSGDRAVVGAGNEDSNATGANAAVSGGSGTQSDDSVESAGAAYLFNRNGETWSQQAYLKASNPGTNDGFGTSVAVSAGSIVVGAYAEGSNAIAINAPLTGGTGTQADNSIPWAGAVYVFTRTGGVWNQQAYLKASNTRDEDYFGYSVALSGETLIVGAFFEDSSATGANGNQTDGSAISAGAVYVFNLPTPDPVIVTPPFSQQVAFGGSATFTITASGIGTLNYQWRKNGIDIPLATSATFNLAFVNKLNEGAYDVVVTDGTGLIISEEAMLTVISPAIFTDPTSRSGYAGQSTTFNVIAAGTGTVTYQWRKSGVNIPTATSSSLALSPLNYRSAADYDVVVTDDFGSATSDPAELTVISPAPSVAISPGDTTVALGGNLTFTATVDTGIPPFTYQWRKNNVLIAKATNPTLVLTNIQRTQEGIYDVVVKNVYGLDVSNIARLSLPPLVAVTANPADTAANPGQLATFMVDAPGATAWQWLKNGVAIKNATSSTLTVLNADASSAGLYSVTVTTSAGKLTTPAAQLRVNDSGLLIYKLTGTGTAYEGTVSTVAALSGYMVLDRAGQRGGLILGSKRGSQSIHSLEVHENLHTQSTGPVPKTQTVVSEMVADEFVLWVNGADSLLTIQKTLSRTDLAVGPATLKGYANSIDIGPKVRIETVSLTLALDAINSIPARQYAETVEQAMSRISQDMQLKGSALVE